ncbi:hypothetical protein D3C84_639790 [compost metagenome]
MLARVGIVGPDHRGHRAANLLRSFLHPLQHRPTITLATSLGDERQVQHADFIGTKISGQRTDGRVELFDHVVHRVGELLSQPLFLYLELLGDDLLNHLSLAVDPLQIRSCRLIKPVQKRSIANARRPHHQTVGHHRIRARHRCSP